MISTKKHAFWVPTSQVMPQNTQILVFWGKNGIGPWLQKKRHFELCEYFLWIKNIKTMWFAPSDILFGCMVQVYWPIAFGPGTGPAHANVSVLTLTSSFSCSRIFPTKLIVQTERVHPRESRKNIIWWVIWCLGVQMFFPNFFPVFSKVKFFVFLYFLNYQVDLNLFFSFSANLGCI